MSLRGQRAVTISSGHAIRFLITLIGNSSVALPAHWVRGIVMPGSAGPDRVVTWAGAHYEPTDLAARLKVKSRDRSADTRLVLYGNEEASRSFVVDRVLGLLDVERAQIHPLPTQFRGRERERLLGFFVAPSCVALIVNPFWAIELPLRPQALEMFAIRFPECKGEDGAPRLPLPEATMNEPVPISTGPVR